MAALKLLVNWLEYGLAALLLLNCEKKESIWRGEAAAGGGRWVAESSLFPPPIRPAKSRLEAVNDVRSESLGRSICVKGPLTKLGLTIGTEGLIIKGYFDDVISNNFK